MVARRQMILKLKDLAAHCRNDIIRQQRGLADSVRSGWIELPGIQRNLEYRSYEFVSDCKIQTLFASYWQARLLNKT